MGSGLSLYCDIFLMCGIDNNYWLGSPGFSFV